MLIGGEQSNQIYTMTIFVLNQCSHNFIKLVYVFCHCSDDEVRLKYCLKLIAAEIRF
jgi:hypothetical protein